MKTQFEPKTVIKLPKNHNAFAIETPDHLPKLHQLLVANGKCGSGKSMAITNLVRMYKEYYKDNLRILIVSPTFGSNYKILQELGIDKQDVFDDPDDDKPNKIIKIANQERDDFLEYEHLVKYYDEFMKNLRGNQFDINKMDNYLMQYFNPITNQFEKPKPKYSWYSTSSFELLYR